jgi:hypothetical protein
MLHEVSREFRQRFHWWQWRMMTMRLHDEHWWKWGRSQRLCGHDMYPRALKPSHSVKACVLSNHVKCWRIHAQVERISMLASFTAQCATSMDNGISDGIVIGRCSMTFQESFDKDSLDGNGEWWQWNCMMNVDENVDNLKDYAGTTCILEPWNPPTPWRHVSYLTMSNFNAYKHNLKEFQCWPISLLNVWHWWIMALVIGL